VKWLSVCLRHHSQAVHRCRSVDPELVDECGPSLRPALDKLTQERLRAAPQEAVHRRARCARACHADLGRGYYADVSRLRGTLAETTLPTERLATWFNCQWQERLSETLTEGPSSRFSFKSACRGLSTLSSIGRHSPAYCAPLAVCRKLPPTGCWRAAVASSSSLRPTVPRSSLRSRLYFFFSRRNILLLGSTIRARRRSSGKLRLDADR
jgi:hypothetical protein